ncbi:pyocin activator PrtN family protein [Pseudoalteromonas aurantia]|uniref:Pyocin activator protein PrtN n=1 Tax=Pseudoalteromonas aurantia 208 TaxID=1314867 RepID=A0ABR9EE31_9GAMM|nr:pyocin activator PrtN family protein [Pseudoalteromonas aurantia]MBE0369238.1 hypothetical protein [Pseudoalteromonas aurantia 208]
MNIQFALLARFNSPTVQLREISQEFFGISPKTAQQKAKTAQLPVPAFKLIESERSPTLVNVSDLAEWIEKRSKEARTEWQQVNG